MTIDNSQLDGFTRQFEYVCNNCKSKYEREVESCSNCGSIDITKVYSDVKYRFVKSLGKRLTLDVDEEYQERKAVERSVNDQSYVVKNLVLSIVIPCSIILGVVLLFLPLSIMILKGEYLYACLIFLIDVLIILTIVDFITRIYNYRKREEYAKEDIINDAPQKYLLVVGLKYDVFEVLGSKQEFGVKVKYYTSNGVCICLNSKKTFKSFPSNTIDLLIDPDYIEDYYIDFGLEKKFEKN